MVFAPNLPADGEVKRVTMCRIASKAVESSDEFAVGTAE